MAHAAQSPSAPKKSSWLASEDWWAVILGLFLVGMTYVGAVTKPFAWLKGVIPATWPKTALSAHFSAQWTAYVFLFLLLAVLTGFAVQVMTGKAAKYLTGFVVLFLGALVILVLSNHETLKKYGLESAFWSLVIGLTIGNLFTLPDWLKAATSRTEFFIKTGIILLGAKLSFNTIMTGGAWGFLEAILIVTFGFSTAFIVARKLGLDRKFAAVLGAGGSVCGVSASIAVGGSVKADEKHVGYVSSLVVLYALALIFILPALAKAMGMNEFVAGAWIGGSELADAAGLAAAAMVSEKAVQTFTLVKLNRDIMIGFLCFTFAYLSVTKWDAAAGGAKPSPRIIWDRFPKFVLAFLGASLIITLLEDVYGAKMVKDNIVGYLNNIRTWLFAIAFLCIGLNTKIKDVRAMGPKPIIAFTAVVAVNFVVGFVCSQLFFGGIIAAPLK